MSREIRMVGHPGDLNANWDSLAKWFYQRKEFLTFLHNYNFCRQRYYELYKDGVLTAGTVVYNFRTNILTFSGFRLLVNMKIIGLPVSIATLPVIGEDTEYEFLLEEILKREKGLILGLNFRKRYLENKVVHMRTLPTIVIDRAFDSYSEYLKALRHPYRRRLNRFADKFRNVKTVVTSCSAFTVEHYSLYLDVMSRAASKLETLSMMLFKNLPGNFILTTYYANDTMLAWNICTIDSSTIFFFMGGLNYEFRDRYQSYQNNMAGIISYAYSNNFKRIDLGQTAEIAKMRLGGVGDERGLFLYHRNLLLMFFLRRLRRMLEYSEIRSDLHVFREPQSRTQVI